jgi:hypothetical protein
MAYTYQILKANRVGLDADESYVIVRNGISFFKDFRWRA